MLFATISSLALGHGGAERDVILLAVGSTGPLDALHTLGPLEQLLGVVIEVVPVSVLVLPPVFFICFSPERKLFRPKKTKTPSVNRRIYSF